MDGRAASGRVASCPAGLWHDGCVTDRYERRINAEVAALEADITAYLPDLDEAWSVRDWAAVARIYRAVALIADRLEDLDPDARSVLLAKAEAVFEAQAALAGDPQDAIDPDELDDEPATDDR
jgi:hypothetical protein